MNDMNDMNDKKERQRKAAAAAKNYRRIVMGSATALLSDWVGEGRAKEAIGRISTAFASARMSARDPQDFDACTTDSIARCIAIAALTGIMPSSGQAALAYVIPRRARKGEAPQLQYQLSHRGIAALARRGGVSIMPILVGVEDELEVEFGEVVCHKPDIDNPPLEMGEIRGGIAVVRDIATGNILARGWVPWKIIARSMEASDSYQWAESKGDWAKSKSSWHAHTATMAMKTVMHYAVNRGWAVIDDTEAVRALAADGQADLYDATAEVVDVVGGPSSVGVAPSAQPYDAPAHLPDYGPQVDELAGARPVERERVNVRVNPSRVQADEAGPTEDADAADLKARAQGIEAQLPPGSVAAIRQEHGIDADVGITTWRGRVSSATAYLDALSGELAAFRKEEADHSATSNPME